MYEINLDNGKYRVIEDLNNGVFKALRHGEEWRDLTGDKLILSLVNEVERLEGIIYNQGAIICGVHDGSKLK